METELTERQKEILETLQMNATGDPKMISVANSVDLQICDELEEIGLIKRISIQGNEGQGQYYILGGK